MSVTIENIQGVVTNADPATLPDTAASDLQNMREINGKLVKTFGYGQIYESITGTVRNIVSYVHDELPGGRAMIAETIDDSTGEVTLLYWNGTAWADIDGLLENTLDTYYHKADTNPVIQSNKILRFLPGSVGEVGGNEAKGIWLGHIDRDLFDGLIEAGTDYNDGFYAYDTELVPPDLDELDISLETAAGGNFNPDDASDYLRHYKLSYVYYGIQESMLSDSVAIEFDKEEMLISELNVDTATFNKRITAIKVYRGESTGGDFRHIHTIDFLRKDESVLSGSDNGYSGVAAAYIPELKSYDLDATKTYRLYVENNGGGAWYNAEIESVGGTGNDVFVVTDDELTDHGPIWKIWDYKNTGWGLWDADAGESGEWVAHNSEGAYAGEDVIIVSEDTGYKSLIGGIVSIDSLNQRRSIIDNLGKAVFTNKPVSLGRYSGDGTAINFHPSKPHDEIRYTGSGLVETYGFQAGQQVQVSGTTNNDGNYTIVRVNESYDGGTYGEALVLSCTEELTEEDGTASLEIRTPYKEFPWNVMDESKGFYYMAASGTTVSITFFDNFLPDGEQHPFPYEKSNKMNGQHVMVAHNTLFLGNIVLDPGGKNEKRNEWLGYSEHGCFDSFPASNVKIMQDREGGNITGVGLSFGAIMTFKEYAYMRMTIGDVTSPAGWIVKEAPFERGNIAEHGYIQVGDSLYIVGSDGIYEANANLAAATDETPMIKSRISEPINDQFLALEESEKRDIQSFYNQLTNEIVFRFKSGVLWAFNIVRKTWRRVSQDITFDVTCLDEHSNVLMYDNSSGKLRSTATDESVKGTIKTKVYIVSNERRSPIRRAYVRYRSEADLRIFLYADNSPVPSTQALLRASAAVITKEVPLRYRCKKFYLEIEETASEDSWEFHGMQIE